MLEEKIVGVRFRRAERVHYFDSGGLDLEVNDYVVVETEQGLRVGKVVIAPKQVIASELTEPLKPILRKANAEDLRKREAMQQKEQEALSQCKELVAKFGLPMKLLEVQSDFNCSRVTIFFSAEGRVDFRQLLRELAGSLKVRVELRQVGSRDAAKMQGGIGRCGYPLCCATFLTGFNPLSIKMVKEQNLPLDTTKISGSCGHLLCCLGYEAELYRLMRDKLPPIGQVVATKLGEAKVIGVNPLKETITAQLESKAIVELSLAEVGIKKPKQI